MSNAIPAQHPAVVLRSQYRQLRSLLAVLLVAVAGLSTTVVVLTLDDDSTTTTSSVSSGQQTATELADPFRGRVGFATPQTSTRPQGGLDESAVAAAIASKPPVSGPDESRIAAAIGSQPQVGPSARDRAYDEAISAMTPKQLAAAFGTGR